MKTYNFTRTLDFKLEVIPTTKRGLKAYRLSCTDSGNPNLKPVTGLCKTKQVSALKLGDPVGQTDWQLVKPKILKSLQKWGWSGKNGDYKHFEYEYNDVFVAIQRGWGQLVKLDNSANMVYNESGEVLPVAIHCDYITHQMNNGSYDMTRLLEILEARDDIHFITDGVEPVPYYNSSADCSSYVAFWWQASVEDYRRMWARCKKIGGAYPSCSFAQAIFEEDLLGLRAGGAAKYETFSGRYSLEESA